MGNSNQRTSIFKNTFFSLPFHKKHSQKIIPQKPIQVSKGITIKRNDITGKYEGVPKEWAQNQQLNLNADLSKTVSTSHFTSPIKPTATIPSQIIKRISQISSLNSKIVSSKISTNSILNSKSHTHTINQNILSMSNVN